jgi:hypothetical protein
MIAFRIRKVIFMVLVLFVAMCGCSNNQTIESTKII